MKNGNFHSDICSRAPDNFCNVCKVLNRKRRNDRHFLALEPLFNSREIFAGPAARVDSSLVN